MVVREGCWALVTVCGWWWWAFITVCGGGCSTCLWCSFQCDVAVDRWGRGDVESTSCQPPVGGRQWWCWVSGVGGNRHGEVAYCIHTKRWHCPSSVCIAWLPHCSATWPGSLVGWFVALGLWGAVFVSSYAGHCLCYVWL